MDPEPPGSALSDHATISSESASSAWGDLPIPLLCHIFDSLLRAPTPHPDYLPGKLISWRSLFFTCRHWRAAVLETGVGACLPRQLDRKTLQWLKKVRLRGVEFHDPDHTRSDVYRLLADDEFISSSKATLQSIIEAPYDGVWQPAAFTYVSQLVIRRAKEHKFEQFDVRAVSEMKNLKILVLSGGFTGMVNVDQLPTNCKTLVINCPGQPQESRLMFPDWPSDKHLDWLSLSAHTTQIDMTKLRGKVKQMNLHTAWLLLDFNEMEEQRRAPRAHREEAADRALEGLAAGLVGDSALMELALNFEMVLVGRRPGNPALNTNLLTGSPLVDIYDYYVDVHNQEVEAIFSEAHEAFEEEQQGGVPSTRAAAGGGSHSKQWQQHQQQHMRGSSSGRAGGEKVQLHTLQHGAELEVIMMRHKEGAAGPTALRLDLPGSCLQDELPKLLAELSKAGTGRRRYHASGPFVSGGPHGPMCPCHGGDAADRPAFDGPVYRSIHFASWDQVLADAQAGAASKQQQALVGSKPAAEGVAAESSSQLQQQPGEESSSGELDAAAACPGAGGSSGAAAADGVLDARAVLDQEAALQAQLLSCSGMVEGSGDVLYEVSGLLAPSTSALPLRSMLSPFMNLTALFLTVSQPLPNNADLLPNTLQELSLTVAGLKGLTASAMPSSPAAATAAAPEGGVAFHAAAISNLVELRRLSLVGFERYDFSAMPAVRPGLCLCLFNPPASRELPLGSAALDILMPQGRIVDMALNISADADESPRTSAPSATSSPSSFSPDSSPSSPTTQQQRPLAVDVTAWAPLCHSMHLYCQNGLRLHAPKASSLSGLMSLLESTGLNHLGLLVGLPPSVLALAQSEGLGVDGNLANVDPETIVASQSIFRVVLAGGREVDGMELVMAVASGSFRSWGVHYHIMENPNALHQMPHPPHGGGAPHGHDAAAGADGAGAAGGMTQACACFSFHRH